MLSIQFGSSPSSSCSRIEKEALLQIGAAQFLWIEGGDKIIANRNIIKTMA
jgi:hypothetical protein